MPILGIENRTENWRTARTFAPLFGDAALRRQFASLLLGEPVEAPVSLELFWHGMRDYGKQQGWKQTDYVEPCAGAYERLFSKLRAQVEEFGRFNELTERHYVASDKTKLASNLLHTEIDIVLESQHHLFIGEAKDESNFGADGRDVLVHQLVRQYVTAAILLDLKGCEKQIVPFVVGEDKDRLCRIGQVRFMIEQEWMRRDNVLCWGDVRGIAGA